jgi:phosphopantothenoylcysteine decarboxylase / phosphopantothenate---cysteine ligase
MKSANAKPRVLLGVTGSVAAYKTVDLIRRLKHFSDIRVVLTEAGSKLVAERHLQKASGHAVWKSLFRGFRPIPPGTPSGTHPQTKVPHIEYAKDAGLVLIAPASADFIAKMALGLGDDLLSTLCLYATCPIWVAPAMNRHMWNNPAVVGNCKTLRQRGIRFLGPESGHLACGETGEGRFAEPSEITLQVESFFKNSGRWKGKKILVTAGPTVEPLDPVRVLTNRSSGKMGYALAQAALNRGADVTLITGPTRLMPPTGARVLQVKTAIEMRREVMRFFSDTNALIMAAAVADYRAQSFSPVKMKKKKGGLTLRLARNPDILEEALKRKKAGQVVVGFAAETEKLQANAGAKWKKKPCDLLVANLVGLKNSGFDADQNELLVFGRKSLRPVRMKKDYKSRLAEKLMVMVEKILLHKR